MDQTERKLPWLTNTGRDTAVQVETGVVDFDHDLTHCGPPRFYEGAKLGPYLKPDKVSDEVMIKMKSIGIYGPHKGRYISADKARELGAPSRSVIERNTEGFENRMWDPIRLTGKLPDSSFPHVEDEPEWFGDYLARRGRTHSFLEKELKESAMNTVDQMIDDLLVREGGNKFVNHPADRGGPTKYGITKATLSRWYARFGRPERGGYEPATIDEVRNLSERIARQIYEQDYYHDTGVAKLPEWLQPFMLDCFVNHRPRPAGRILQKALNDLFNLKLDADGIIGPKTVLKAQFVNDKERQPLWLRLCHYRLKLYTKIVASDHSQVEFLQGWLNRLAEFENQEV